MLSYPSSSGTPDWPNPQHSIRRLSVTAQACRLPAAIRRFAAETSPMSGPPGVPPEPSPDTPPVDASAPPDPSAPPVVAPAPDCPPLPGLPLPSPPSLQPSNETAQNPTNTAIQSCMAPS